MTPILVLISIVLIVIFAYILDPNLRSQKKMTRKRYLTLVGMAVAVVVFFLIFIGSISI